MQTFFPFAFAIEQTILILFCNFFDSFGTTLWWTPSLYATASCQLFAWIWFRSSSKFFIVTAILFVLRIKFRELIRLCVCAPDSYSAAKSFKLSEKCCNLYHFFPVCVKKNYLELFSLYIIAFVAFFLKNLLRVCGYCHIWRLMFLSFLEAGNLKVFHFPNDKNRRLTTFLLAHFVEILNQLFQTGLCRSILHYFCQWKRILRLKYNFEQCQHFLLYRLPLCFLFWPVHR